MAKKENSKKAAGNAKKAEQANKKLQEAADALEKEESSKWEQGSKKANKKKEDEQLKKQEMARKKAERDSLLEAEEASMPSKPQTSKQRGAAKVAAKRTGKIDDFLDFNAAKPNFSASGIDNAIEALTLATSKDGGIDHKDFDKHPERRVKAAYLEFEESRLPQLRKENPGLRLQQIKALLHKEFQKSPANPLNNDTNIAYNTSAADITARKADIRSQREQRFA